MRSIGGYFTLELSNKWAFPHDDGVLLNSGRTALEFVLRASAVKFIYIPYYTCQSVLEPIEKLGIPYTYYHINEDLEIAENILPKEGEYLLFTNYFGVKDQYCEMLTKKYGNSLIIDNSQALYAKQTLCAGTVYSPRKFVGIPDGGIAYCNNSIEIDGQDESYDRCSHLLKRYDLGANGGYEDFHTNSAKLHNQPIKRMSVLTRSLLQNIDFEKVKAQRLSNFKKLHDVLGCHNHLSELLRPMAFTCPMVYPFLTDNTELKRHLISRNIFVATYWPNVFEWCESDDVEYQLADKCLALPIDQRYGKEDMEYIIENIFI